MSEESTSGESGLGHISETDTPVDDVVRGASYTGYRGTAGSEESDAGNDASSTNGRSNGYSASSNGHGSRSGSGGNGRSGSPPNGTPADDSARSGGYYSQGKTSSGFPTDEEVTEFERYRELAFQLAIAHGEPKEKEKERLLERIRAMFTYETSESYKRHNDFIEKISTDIAEIEEEIDALKRYSESIRDRQKAYEERIEATKRHLRVARHELNIEYRRLAIKRHTLRNQLLPDFLEELKTFTDQLAQEKDDLQKEMLSSLKEIQETANEIFEQRQNRLEADHEDVKTTLDDIRWQTLWYRRRGATADTARVLVNTGITATVAGGWFLGAFTGATGIGSDDALSFVLERFGDLAASVQANPGAGTGLAVLIIVLLVAVVGASALLWSRSLVRSGNRIGSDRTVGAALRDTVDRLLSRLQYRKWISFWARLIPAFVLGGIVFLLLSVPPGATNLESITDSMYGYTVGVLFILSFAGLVLASRIMFGRPRRIQPWHQQPYGGTNTGREETKASEPEEVMIGELPSTRRDPSSLLVGFVTVTSMVFLLALMAVGIYDGFGAGDEFPLGEVPLTLSGFVFSVLAAGTAIGFGLPIFHLYQEETRLQEKLDAINDERVGPLPDEVARLARDLRESLGKTMKEASDEVNKQKTRVSKLLEEIYPNQTDYQRWSSERRAQMEAERTQGLRTWVRSLFWGHDTDPTDGQSEGTDRQMTSLPEVDMRPVERNMFPDLSERIDATRLRIHELRVDLEETKHKLIKTRTHATEEDEEIESRIDTLKKRKRARQDKRDSVKTHRYERYRELDRLHTARQTGIHDGYHLGMEYREFVTSNGRNSSAR